MKGLSVEPGERLALVPSTCPEMGLLKKSAEPTSARISMLGQWMSSAEALFSPYLLPRAAKPCTARSRIF